MPSTPYFKGLTIITKSNKAKQVCELDPLADIYLINYFFTHDHHVCFMNILK